MDEPRCDRCEHASIEHETETTVSFTCIHPESDKPIGYYVAPRGVSPSSCPLRNPDLKAGTPSWVGTLPKQQNPESLADAHWDYVKAVLEHAGETPEIIGIIGFHYRTAMIHGYKHGRNDG